MEMAFTVFPPSWDVPRSLKEALPDILDFLPGREDFPRKFRFLYPQIIGYIPSLEAYGAENKGASAAFISNYELIKGKAEEREREFQRSLEAKRSSLPKEPPLDDENATFLKLKFRDGSSIARRFFVTDKLSDVFNYVITNDIFNRRSYFKLAMQDTKKAFDRRHDDDNLRKIGFEAKVAYKVKSVRFFSGDVILFASKEGDSRPRKKQRRAD